MATFVALLPVALIALAVGPVAAQAPSQPDPQYQVGTVPITGPDTTNTNVGGRPAPDHPIGSTGNGASSDAPQPAPNAGPGVTLSGAGPLSTDNGVAAARPTVSPREAASTPASGRRPAQRARKPAAVASATEAAKP